MKFAKLLLESYSRLYEKATPNQGGVQELINKSMSISAPGQTIPVQGYSDRLKRQTTGEVGRSENGPYLKGGPFGSKTVSLISATPEQSTEIDNWLAGAGGSLEINQKNLPEGPEIDLFSNNALVQGMKGKKKEENIDRIRKVEETFPGYLQTITNFFDNVKEGIAERYGKPVMVDGKYTTPITESTLISKLIGGRTEGSVTHNIEQEIGSGTVRRESKSEGKVLFARDTTDLEAIQGVMDTFDRLGEAYKKMTTCDATDDDFKFIRENIRKDTKTNAYFYKDPTSNNNFGMALSLADQNIMNLVGEDYNKRVDECDNIEDKEAAKIPTMEIAPVVTEGGGNYSNIVKEASERIVVVAHLAATGRAKEAGALLSGIISDFGKNVFIALNAKRRADRGQHVVDEGYSEIFDHLDFMGVETADDIRKAAKEHFLPYFSEIYDDMKELNASYVTRVGGGSVGSGDKTDVDYVWKEKPDLSKTDFSDAKTVEVKFEDLDPATQRDIRRSGDPIQETYHRLDDSLKYYGKEGDVKTGDSSTVRTSLGRLVGIAPSTSRDPERDIEHGRRTMDKIRTALASNPDLDVDKEMAKVEQKIRDIHKASESVSKLMDTDSWTNPNYKGSTEKKKMIRKHLEGIFEGAGMGDFNKFVKVKDVFDVYEKQGSDAAAGMIDRAIMQAMLSKDIVVDRKGNIDKKKSLTSLAAFAALHASTGIDTMDNRNPMSSIKIKETGNLYRENQNDMIMEPITDLLNVESNRGLNMGQQTWRIDRDGAFMFSADKRRCSGTSYINTNYLNPRSRKKN